MTTATDIILAAAASTPDQPGWMAAVQQKAALLAVLVNPASPFAKTIEAVATGDVKVFSGIVRSVDYNPKMRRHFVALETGTSKGGLKGINNRDLPLGQESVRTDFADSGGDDMAAVAREHMGQRVRVYVHMEPITEGAQKGQSVRIVKFIEPAAEPVAQPVQYAPQPQPVAPAPAPDSMSARVSHIARDASTSRAIVTLLDATGNPVIVVTPPTANNPAMTAAAHAIKAAVDAGASITFTYTGAEIAVEGVPVSVREIALVSA